MIRQKIHVSDFPKIAKEHNYFIWHFIQKKQYNSFLAFYSYFDEEFFMKGIYPRMNLLKQTLDKIDIPYFESYTEESIDFLMENLKFKGSELYTPRYVEEIHYDKEQFYRPVLVGFNKFKPVFSTRNVCYCTEGLIEIVLKLNPDLILNVNWD